MEKATANNVPMEVLMQCIVKQQTTMAEMGKQMSIMSASITALTDATNSITVRGSQNRSDPSEPQSNRKRRRAAERDTFDAADLAGGADTSLENDAVPLTDGPNVMPDFLLRTTQAPEYEIPPKCTLDTLIHDYRSENLDEVFGRGDQLREESARLVLSCFVPYNTFI
jgi:hypothetical protein